MDTGRVVALDTPSNLLSRLGSPYLVKLVTSRPMLPQEVEGIRWSPEDVLVADGDTFQLRVKDAPRSLSISCSGPHAGGKPGAPRSVAGDS